MLKIAVLGTGTVGNTVGSKLIELGHSVMLGSRMANKDKALEFVAKYKDKASAGTFADAAEYGEIIFNCTSGIGSLDALILAGEENLNGKIIVDIANPLDFTNGTPPSLFVSNTDSLGEQIQKAFPLAMVVKTLNTMWCNIMVNPEMINEGDHNVFMSGDDGDAKNHVKEILKSFGWAENNIIDLGGIKTARSTEMFLPLWLSIYGIEKNAAFNIKIVK